MANLERVFMLVVWQEAKDAGRIREKVKGKWETVYQFQTVGKNATIVGSRNLYSVQEKGIAVLFCSISNDEVCQMPVSIFRSVVQGMLLL